MREDACERGDEPQLSHLAAHQFAPSGSTFKKALNKIGIVGVFVNEGTNDVVADGVHRNERVALGAGWKES